MSRIASKSGCFSIAAEPQSAGDVINKEVENMVSSPTNYRQKLASVSKIERTLHMLGQKALVDRNAAKQAKVTGTTPADPERWGVFVIRPILRKVRPKYDYRCRVAAELQEIFGLKGLRGRHSFEFDLKRRTGKRVRLNKQLRNALWKQTPAELEDINQKLESFMSLSFLKYLPTSD